MCFDGSLGNVQIASDFRVVTSLEQQIDDLSLPGPHLAEFFFHKRCTCPTRPGRRKWLVQPGPWTHLDSGLCVSFCIHAAKSRFSTLTNDEIFGCGLFPLGKWGYKSHF